MHFTIEVKYYGRTANIIKYELNVFLNRFSYLSMLLVYR